MGEAERAHQSAILYGWARATLFSHPTVDYS